MATAYSDTVAATAEKPYILTHRVSGERYAYSARHLDRTEKLYLALGEKLDDHYTVVNEWNGEKK